jgi:hypothetical protein
MQKIEILDNRDKPDNYCPICGTKNIEFNKESSKINECKHLVYIGSDEGPEFDKKNIYSKIENDENSTEDALGKIFSDEYTCFTLSMGAPSGLNGYIVYKFDDK